jgi:class 3 adenylate cyclase/tetratricopeptide (TPR) repeat protein
VLPDAEQRKVLTVLFADMTGSTELSARLDPERFREVLAAFYKLVSDELAALGGRAENFIGDAVLGVFGLPQAHDDDAVRAIRAALSMVEAAPALGEQMALPVPLRVRVGINTGSVAVGAAVGSELVLGAEVNLAARLQQSAGPGEVLVGPTTRQLAGTWIEFGPGRDVEAKGFDAGVVAYPVLGPSKGTTKRGIRFVGRRREIELLTGTFERVVERSRAHLVTLVGEPGIGKSRVAEEFLDRLPGDTTVLVGRATSFGENATFGPIAEMLLRRMGDPVEEPDLRRLLVQTVARSTHPSEAAVTTARLGLALGLGDGPAGESRYREGEVRAGLLTFATGLARSGPVVLVFEDLHLAQPALLQLIERLVREAGRVPLLVVCVARWDFLEDHPAWAGGIADAVTLWLEPLPEDEATELAMAAAEGMRREDAVRVAAHAGGNPFFIVETAAMLAHGDGARASGRPPERVLPPTVQAVIAERLDHLSPAARDLARKASVFARPAFELVDLELIAQPNEAALVELEDEEILVRDEEREGTWRFRHDLLRDVAYDSLTKRERLRLHLRIAEHLARPESADRYPRAIAYHLERAARASLDLDPKDRSLAERAVDALERAGDLARRGIESRAAIDLYERALALAGPESGYGPREAWILSAIGEAGYWLGEFDAAADALSRALEIGRDDTRIRAHASRYLADIYLTVRAEGSRSAELFAESLAASRELGDPFVLARTLLMAAWQPYWENDLGRARETFEEALAVARDNPSGDAWGVARALVGLSSVTSPAGSEGDVLALAEEAVRIGQKSGDAFTTAVARGTTAASLRRMMRLDEALDHSSAAVRTFRELDARWELASSLGDRGSIHRLAGRPEEAEADLREAYRLCRDLKERSLVTWTAAELVRLLVAKGEAGAARQLLDEPQARLAAAEPSSLASLLSAEALVALEEGDPDGARVKAREAVEVQRAQALPNPLAAQVWWTGRVFGAEAVGGARELEEARAVLEAASWAQALHEPDLVRARTAAGG